MIKYTKKEFQNKVLNKRSVYYMISTSLPLLFIPVINWQSGVLLFLLQLLFITPMFLSDAIAYFQCSRDFNRVEQPTWELFNKIIHEAQWDNAYNMFVEVGGIRYNKYEIIDSFSFVEWQLLDYGFTLAGERLRQEGSDKLTKEAQAKRKHITSVLCNQEG